MEKQFKLLPDYKLNDGIESINQPKIKTYEELETELIETRTLLFNNLGRMSKAESEVFKLKLDLQHEEMIHKSEVRRLESEVKTYKQLVDVYSSKVEKLEKRTLFDFLFG